MCTQLFVKLGPSTLNIVFAIKNNLIKSGQYNVKLSCFTQDKVNIRNYFVEKKIQRYTNYAKFVKQKYFIKGSGVVTKFN